MPSEGGSLRFLADMGVSQRVVVWLRSQKHEVVHLREKDLQRLEDRAIFAKAAAEQRAILTFDLDFGEIAALSLDVVVSVILFRLHDTTTAHVIDRLRTVLSESRDALLQGAVIVVEESRHRVRRLPIAGP